VDNKYDLGNPDRHFSPSRQDIALKWMTVASFCIHSSPSFIVALSFNVRAAKGVRRQVDDFW
jgi:hypothetical protein